MTDLTDPRKKVIMHNYHYLVTLQSPETGQTITVSGEINIPPTVTRSEFFTKLLAQLTGKHFPSGDAVVLFFDLQPNSLG
ncbi:hypothetical protein AB0C21_21640 [Spirillospora sp. NPDC049024]